MSMITRDEAAALMEAATPSPFRLSIYQENPPDGVSPAERVAQNLAYGSGDVWGVIAPEHPLSVGGWDDTPEHAVVTCITGNGPTSEANARLYSTAWDLASTVVALHDRIATLRAVAVALAENVERDDGISNEDASDALTIALAEAVGLPPEAGHDRIGAALRALAGGAS